MQIREITAIIRSGKWSDTARELRAAGFHAVTRQRALGRGKQKGLSRGGGGVRVRLLPKWLLSLAVEEGQVEAAVEALIRANRTGEIGDGKIFVSPVGGVLRVRTEETGYPALC